MDKHTMNTDAPAFVAWLDRFFAAYYRRRPVKATFVGIHDYDDRLPDFSEHAAGDTLAEMEALLAQVRKLPPEPLTRTEALDRLLAEGFLQIQCWEAVSGHFHRGNPSLYTGEAIFGVLSLFLSDFAPLAWRVEAAIARMRAVPILLAQGRARVRQAPLAWTEQAIRECTGAMAFFKNGIDEMIRADHLVDPRFRAAADQTAAAFADHQHQLEIELRRQPRESCACGEAALDLLMRQGHFVDKTPAEIVRYAEQQMEEEDVHLAAHAVDFAQTEQSALTQLADLHPTLEGYYARYSEVWEACRATAEDRELLTWPDFPIRYVPRPAWARKAAAYLYFLFYRSPAAFGRPPVHDYLVTPIEASMPADERQRLLCENNDSVIKLNHVVHHGAIGHHVQNWHAYRATSRIGQVAAVDCATRIAMFCGGTMAEGWACYATQLMGEVGFLTPLELYAEHHTRRRMCARAIVDVRLHQGHLSLDAAAAFYQQRAGMGAKAAYGEAVRNSMFPGAAMMYLIGTDRIQQLRREMARRWGTDFSLRRFHDLFLSYGSVPVALIAREMERTPADGQLPLGRCA